MSNPDKIPIVIVVAMGKDTRVIGNNDSLMWHIPDDLKRFKELTLGHPIIMGRKTFESIVKLLGKPLPGRTNIVVTRNKDYQHEGVEIVHSLTDGIELAASQHPTEIHIGGGGELYRQALPYTDKLFVTEIDDRKAGDTKFPEFASKFLETTRHGSRTYEGITYEWVDYERKK